MSGPSSSAAAEVRVIDAEGVVRTLRRLAHEIIERHPDVAGVVIAGVRSGGVPVAAVLAGLIDELSPDARPGLAAIDVAGYRDDAPRAMARLNGTWAALPRRRSDPAPRTAPAIDSSVVILVDDVMQTGRTMRAALDAVSAHGRAAAVESAVLIDRGTREVPIRPTYIGKNIPTATDEWVDVRVWDVEPAQMGAFLVKRS